MCGAVECRAREVQTVYERHARVLDEHAVAHELRVRAEDVRQGLAEPGWTCAAAAAGVPAVRGARVGGLR